MADAEIDIIHYGSSGIPPDCGIPQGANFVYSDHNQAGSSTNEGKVMSNINVGNGGNLMGILKDNGSKLKDFQDAVVEKLNDVNVTMGKDGVKVNGVDSIKDEFKKYTDTFKNKDMSPKVTVDTSDLAEANKTIAQGVEVQNRKNEILTKKLEYEVGQKITDSRGNETTPMEAKANKDVEVALITKEENLFDWSKFNNYTDNLLNGGLFGENNSENDDNLDGSGLEELIKSMGDVDEQQIDDVVNALEPFFKRGNNA